MRWPSRNYTTAALDWARFHRRASAVQDSRASTRPIAPALVRAGTAEATRGSWASRTRSSL